MSPRAFLGQSSGKHSSETATVTEMQRTDAPDPGKSPSNLSALLGFTEAVREALWRDPEAHVGNLSMRKNLVEPEGDVIQHAALSSPETKSM